MHDYNIDEFIKIKMLRVIQPVFLYTILYLCIAGVGITWTLHIQLQKEDSRARHVFKCLYTPNCTNNELIAMMDEFFLAFILWPVAAAVAIYQRGMTWLLDATIKVHDLFN